VKKRTRDRNVRMADPLHIRNYFISVLTFAFLSVSWLDAISDERVAIREREG